jgi:Domain of unknown function (DUF4837)
MTSSGSSFGSWDLKRIVLAMLLITLCVASGCDFDKEKGILMAAGSYGDLAVVVSDRDILPLAERFVGGLNAKKVFVIKEEHVFKPDIFRPNKLDIAKGYKNAILLVRIGDGGPVEKEVKGRVSNETWEKLSTGSGGMVQLNDPWATYQTVLVVASRDRNSLGSILNKKTENIRTLFDESSRQRILRRNRYTGLDTQLMNTYRERFGFSLEIPKDFKQNQVFPNEFPGLELLQASPSRGITISWLQTEDVEGLMARPESLLAMRRDMGDKMHTEDIVTGSLVWLDAVVGGLDVVKLEGAWTSRRFTGGGAFWSYFIPDPSHGRVICLDLLVYAPGMEKMPMFRTLDAIASSFTLH